MHCFLCRKYTKSLLLARFNTYACSGYFGIILVIRVEIISCADSWLGISVFEPLVNLIIIQYRVFGLYMVILLWASLLLTLHQRDLSSEIAAPLLIATGTCSISTSCISPRPFSSRSCIASCSEIIFSSQNSGFMSKVTIRTTAFRINLILIQFWLDWLSTVLVLTLHLAAASLSSISCSSGLPT